MFEDEIVNNTKICPSCGQKIAAGDTQCRFCQQAFVRCGGCGREIGAGAGFCNFCGSRLIGQETAASAAFLSAVPSGDEQPPLPDQTKKPSRLLWLVLFILVLAIGGAACFTCTHTLLTAPSGFTAIKKDACSFSEISLDISSWELTELYRHERVRRAILDGDIPDFDGTRLKLAALQDVDIVIPDAEAVETVLETIDTKAKETGDMLEKFSNELRKREESR